MPEKCPGCGLSIHLIPDAPEDMGVPWMQEDETRIHHDRQRCLEVQLDQLRETNQRLNRRCQEAEAGLADAKRMIAHLTKGKTPYCGGSMGRAFLAYDNHLLAEELAQLQAENERLRAMEKRLREAKLEHFWLAYHTATMRLNEERVGTEFPAEEETEVDHWWPAVKARLLREEQGKESQDGTATPTP